jgi:protocatechuate 3,4-dioxygenase beta subunit
VTLRPATRLGDALITHTDAAGHYAFASLAPGAYTVSVAPPAGYFAPGEAEQTVEVTANHITQADFPLRAYVHYWLPVMAVWTCKNCE